MASREWYSRLYIELAANRCIDSSGTKEGRSSSLLANKAGIWIGKHSGGSNGRCEKRARDAFREIGFGRGTTRTSTRCVRCRRAVRIPARGTEESLGLKFEGKVSLLRRGKGCRGRPVRIGRFYGRWPVKAPLLGPKTIPYSRRPLGRAAQLL